MDGPAMTKTRQTITPVDLPSAKEYFVKDDLARAAHTNAFRSCSRVLPKKL